jgi:hypothetical protein
MRLAGRLVSFLILGVIASAAPNTYLTGLAQSSAKEQDWTAATPASVGLSTARF